MFLIVKRTLLVSFLMTLPLVSSWAAEGEESLGSDASTPSLEEVMQKVVQIEDLPESHPEWWRLQTDLRYVYQLVLINADAMEADDLLETFDRVFSDPLLPSTPHGRRILVNALLGQFAPRGSGQTPTELRHFHEDLVEFIVHLVFVENAESVEVREATVRSLVPLASRGVLGADLFELIRQNAQGIREKDLSNLSRYLPKSQRNFLSSGDFRRNRRGPLDDRESVGREGERHNESARRRWKLRRSSRKRPPRKGPK